MITLSIATMRERGARNLDARIDALAAHLGRRPADDEPVPFSSWVHSTPDVDDLYWDLRHIEGGAQIATEARSRASIRSSQFDRIADRIGAYSAYRRQNLRIRWDIIELLGGTPWGAAP